MIRDLQRSRARLFLIPVALLTALYLGKQAVGPEYYGVARLAQAATAVAVIVPICAALAAWEGSRLRQASVSSLAPVRSELRIAVRMLLPIWFLALVAIGVATVLMLLDGARVQPEDLVILAMPVAVTLGHTAVGYLAGRRVPAVFAIPGALIGSWLWLVYPISLEPLWLRHLSGYPIDCCDTSTVLATGALEAPILTGVAACVAVAIALLRLSVASRAVLGVAVASAALAVSVSLVSDLGANPTSPRPETELACHGEAPQICLWPEHSSAAHLVSVRARQVRTRLASVGVKSPAVVSEGRADRDWLIGVTPQPDVVSVDTTLIEGLLPRFPRCARGRASYPGIRAYWPMALWLARTARASSARLKYSVTTDDRAQVAAVAAAPLRRQLDWYRGNVRALSTCGVAPTTIASR